MQTPPTTDSVKPKKNRALWLFQWILILAVAAMAAIIFFLYQRFSFTLVNLQTTLNQQQQSLTALQGQIQSLSSPALKKARTLTQVDYLLRMASLHLNAEGDTTLAIQLLKIADEEVSATNDPSFFSLRQALANDLAALQAIPVIDRAGMVIKINAISQQISQLPVLPTQLAIPNHPQKVIPATLPVWKKGLMEMGEALENVVVIRHGTQAKQPLITPEQRSFLILNIQLHLAQAQWAILHQQPELFQQNLTEVSQWIRQYFVQDSALTQSVLKDLNLLLNTSIKPNLPDISNSINVLERLNNNLMSVDTLRNGNAI